MGDDLTRNVQPCPMAMPHDAHGWTSLGTGRHHRCPGWSEPDGGVKEPAPRRSDAQRVRDLKYVIQRAREALGTDTPAAPCVHAERITALEGALRDDLDEFGPATADKLGARCILAFTDPIDLPGEGPEPDPRTAAVIATVRDVLGIDMAQGPADLFGVVLAACEQVRTSEAARDRLRVAREEARNWARHGYEIGQRHCGWSDHGVAPAWLTDGWPPHIEACEHAARAAEYDTALTLVRGLSELPGHVHAAHESDSDYAFGYRDAIREAKRAARTEPGEATP